MIKKENCNFDIEKVIKIAEKYDIKKSKEDFELILKESNEFKINVVFIGSFIGRKSSTRNSYSNRIA